VRSPPARAQAAIPSTSRSRVTAGTYNLTDGQHALGGFRTANDGSLTAVGSTPGLPPGAIGIAVS